MPVLVVSQVIVQASTYVTSGRDPLRLAAASLARGSAVIVADPAYGQSAGKVGGIARRIQPARSPPSSQT